MTPIVDAFAPVVTPSEAQAAVATKKETEETRPFETQDLIDFAKAYPGALADYWKNRRRDRVAGTFMLPSMIAGGLALYGVAKLFGKDKNAAFTYGMLAGSVAPLIAGGLGDAVLNQFSPPTPNPDDATEPQKMMVAALLPALVMQPKAIMKW